MPRITQEGIDVIATNFWFGSRYANALSAGTATLERLYSERMPVDRIIVECDVPDATEHEINHFGYYADAFRRLRERLDDPFHFRPQDFLFFGQRAADSYERAFTEKQALACISADPDIGTAVRRLAAELDDRPAYIHIDVDAFRPDIYPNPKCNVPGGLDFDAIAAAIAAIRSRSKVVGYAIAESTEIDEDRVHELARICTDLLSSTRLDE